ncbi:MAG: hypothetical protein ACQET7_06965 [Thermodesulfobacteriota bacterium]
MKIIYLRSHVGFKALKEAAGLRVSVHLDMYGRPYRKSIRWTADPNSVAVGRKMEEETDWDPSGWVAVPIADNGVRVEDRDTLVLAQDLHSITHSAGPGGIDSEQERWFAHRPLCAPAYRDQGA